MKALLFTSGAILLASVVHAQTPPLAFPEAKIEVPALSLLDLSKSPWLSVPTARDFSLAPPVLPVARSITVSRMPVLVPGENVDEKMVVKPGNDRIKYTLITKTPVVISTK